MKKFALLAAIVLLFLSCSKKDIPKSSDKAITKFVFTKVNNPSLTEDVEGIITGNEIKVVLHGSAKTSLKPTITYTSKSISSNEDAKDFTSPVVYTLSAEDGSTANYTVKVASRDVYLAGYVYTASRDYPAYWKNGNEVALPIGNGVNAETSGIVVNGNDVYVTGTIYGFPGKAVYWKNGTLTELAPGAISSTTLDIQLYNGDVYILGVMTNTDNTKNYAYWKNGVKTVINNIMPNMGLYFMRVNANGIYFGGYINENQESKAAYWKDGNRIWVSNETASLSSLTMVGNDLYAFGTHQQTPVYWKNGTRNTYSFDSNDHTFDGTIINNDIYMVGNRYDISNHISTAVYWKNGIRTNLNAGTNHANASFITTVENDIYIAGWECTPAYIFSPIYWINGKKVSINFEGSCDVSSIFVKSN